MSRQREAIVRALDAAGIPYRSIDWEPRGHAEPSGGWCVIGLDHEYLGGAYNATSLVRAIEDAARRPDTTAGSVNGRMVVTGLDPEDAGGWIDRPITKPADEETKP